MTFNEEEKIRLFNKIEEHYFRRNFGSMSKTDLETLLFSEYIECCINNNVPHDDYSLSKELGVTQARIRSLKERKELKYPRNEGNPDWWKVPFAEAVKTAKYDDRDQSIKFIIQDVNVLTEARHFVEESGWYDDYSLNRKLVKISLACFAEIFLEEDHVGNILSESEMKKLRKLAKEHTELSQLIDDCSKDGFKAFLMSASKEAIGVALRCLPFGGITGEVFKRLADVIIKM